ncbi:glycosyltransferase involved in cell wall biosynthesis [Ilumatobacter fluminis]|uniref:Glycosyltransferase involved in cell wall biosynthesis n=1 Tax=Ilumatobacter fluminis TaxID=467091 RepID=A0A4R7I0Y6_9ACTN|nr:glycosyltransferase family 4 protein [Ilumatobacter fluminis]TDT16519.1 glycosyltransferase involved in cell wall biosynthesis [Ilumatobacter fluminis]
MNALNPVPEHDLAWYVDDLRQRGIRRVHVLAWRDLDDADAGGSEVHADEVMRRWADLGLDVLHRTSYAEGLPTEAERNGYRVVRRGSRYTVFGRTVASELTRRMGPYDALVEIWNGVPWFSPIWCRRPRVTVLHHVHGPMWDQMLPGPLGPAGRFLESRLAPPFYRRGLTVTGAETSRDELLELGFRPDRVLAVPYGVDPRFSPGGTKTAQPSVVAVGRLAPVKRFDRVIDAVVAARREVDGLTATIVGRGPLADELQARIDAAGAGGYIRLAGRVDDADLIDLYRSSWLVTSGSIAEGWGLSLTEGAGCGTPALATDIRGHRNSVLDGRSGVLVPPDRLATTMVELLHDRPWLDRLAAGAREWGASLTWERSALGLTAALHAEVLRSGGHDQ